LEKKLTQVGRIGAWIQKLEKKKKKKIPSSN